MGLPSLSSLLFLWNDLSSCDLLVSPCASKKLLRHWEPWYRTYGPGLLAPKSVPGELRSLNMIVGIPHSNLATPLTRGFIVRSKMDVLSVIWGLGMLQLRGAIERYAIFGIMNVWYGLISRTQLWEIKPLVGLEVILLFTYSSWEICFYWQEMNSVFVHLITMGLADSTSPKITSVAVRKDV